jgi:hypothetical protein
MKHPRDRRCAVAKPVFLLTDFAAVLVHFDEVAAVEEEDEEEDAAAGGEAEDGPKDE